MPNIEEILQTRPVQDSYHRAILNIFYTSHWLDQELNASLRSLSISEPQFNVLRILRGQNGGTMNLYEIQSRMVQQMSNVSRLIDRLLVKGYVTRDEDPANRRRVNIGITEKGLDLLKKFDPVHDEWYGKLGGKLSEDEASELSRLLEKVRTVKND